MIPVGSHPVWHPVFETLAYAAGYGLFRRLRAHQGDVVAEPQRWTVIASAAVGALVGSRLLGLAEQWPTVEEAWRSGHFLKLVLTPGGKTIVCKRLIPFDTFNMFYRGELETTRLAGLRREEASAVGV